MQGNTLSKALDIPRGVSAFVGGGGKTTLIMELAEELSSKYKVLVTASAKMRKPKCKTLIAPSAREVLSAFEKTNLLALGSQEAEDKLGRLAELEPIYPVLADCVLTEADGAHNLPLKAPAEHEPVIPREAALVVAVLGLDGIGKPISQACHRPEIYAKAAGAEILDIITPEMAASVLMSEAGQRKGVSCRFAAVLNKADNAERLESAREIARRLNCTVLITALKGEKKLLETWRDGVCSY